MKKAIVNLLKVKTIISLAVIFTTCYMTIKGQLDTTTFSAITGSVITYYFTRKDNETNE